MDPKTREQGPPSASSHPEVGLICECVSWRGVGIGGVLPQDVEDEHVGYGCLEEGEQRGWKRAIAGFDGSTRSAPHHLQPAAGRMEEKERKSQVNRFVIVSLTVSGLVIQVNKRVFD